MDYTHIDTTPGAGTFLAPPKGLEGDYTALMRERYRSLQWGQEFVSCAIQSDTVPIQITGPYAREAARILIAIGARATHIQTEEAA
jgi:hypothetical protein